MPPPPAIGSARSSTGAPENAPGAAPGHPAGTPGNAAAAAEERAGETGGGGASEGSTTPRPRADEGPSEDAGSRSLPVDAARLRVPTPMPASSTVPRVPAIDGEASGTLKVPLVGAAGDSAGSWPRTDGWDLDDDDGSAGAGGGSASVPSVPSVPKAAASSVPSIPKLGSIPSIPKPAGKEVGAGPSVPKPGATKEAGSVPSVPKAGATKEVGSGPSVPKTGASKEVGSVPSVPKLGSVPKVGPLPKPGARPTPAPKRAAAEDADARPLFGTALSADGSLLSSSTGASASASAEPALEALASFDLPPLDAAIDASAPPSSASPLDALPSFDPAPSEPGTPQDGFPSMDSSALLGVALEPVVPFEPGPPRLPVPGMLRDGAALSAADFRGPARTPNVQPAAAMPPPRGMVPPKPRDEDEAPRLRPGDTQSFVAQVAEELMEEVDRQRAEKAAAAAALASEASPEPEPVAARSVAAMVPPASDPRPPLNLFPLTPTPPPTREAEAARRGRILGLGAIGLVAALGLFVWLSGDDEPPTQTAAVTSPPRSDADEAKAPAADAREQGDAKADSPAPPPPVEAEPEPAADGEAVAAAPGAESAADPAEPMEAEGDAGAEAAAEPMEAEPVDDGASQAGSSPRKSSGRGSRPSGKSGGSSTPKEEPAPAPKTDDAPSAAKLLKQARSAYNAGKGSTAYSLASKSNRMQPSGEAAEVMALAACQMGDANKAKAALRTVPLFSRGGVRSTCKSKHDVKLGL